MINEWLMILIMAVCGAAFAAGGTHIDGIGGQKWIRRFGIPLFLFGMSRLIGVYIWGAVGMSVLLCVALHMGYGERAPYWKKALIFAGYGLPFLFVGWSWWIIIMPVVCLTMFRLSNWRPLSKAFFWKSVELLYGVMIGITFIDAVSYPFK